ncbi:hypothetical protein ABW21_db0203963 [Orbilia brochopaga]|nr:hypothetical protein ABW21_db0203963 [Drechslerella brochopaga]
MVGLQLSLASWPSAVPVPSTLLHSPKAKGLAPDRAFCVRPHHHNHHHEITLSLWLVQSFIPSSVGQTRCCVHQSLSLRSTDLRGRRLGGLPSSHREIQRSFLGPFCLYWAIFATPAASQPSQR